MALVFGRRSEAGEGRIGCIFWALVFIVILAIAWQAVPAKMASSELYDYMVDEANYADRRSAEGMRKRIMEKAEELNVPLAKKNLSVTKSTSRVKMEADYTMVLRFPLGIEHEWDFHHEVDRPIYYY